jgi:cytochrome b
VGYVILTLLFWRLMWGFTGSETARFSTMVRAVHGLPEQLRTMGKRGGEHPAGYGALGSLAIIGFLSLLTVQALLGLFSQDNPQMTGPLANYVPAEVSKAITDWHDWIFFSVIVPVVVIHAAAALYHHVWKRDPIVSAMVTGKKPVAGPAPALGSPRMALTCLVIAAGTVAAIAMLRI